MQEFADSLIVSGTQCWTCPVFDKLFTIISNTAGAAYKKLAFFGVIIFCVMFAFYILNAVWENIKSGSSDSFFQKSVKPVVIKALVALTLLSAGLMVPRLISTVTFEPVAQITLAYSKSMLPEGYPVNDVYVSEEQDGDQAFFTPKLRSTLLQLIKTSITNFQVYIQLGVDIINSAFAIETLLGIGTIIKHMIVFFIGIFLTYNFAKLFIKYSFCFMDIIVAMAMFAFFFPLSIILFIFKDAQSAPGWMKKLGSELGGGQIKKLVNAIVSVGATILTYTIIMVIIGGFLNLQGTTTESFADDTIALFNFDLDHSTAMQITLAGAIVLVYIINYIEQQIPQITKKILSTFGLSQEDSLSKEMGENAWKLTTIVAEKTKNIAKTIINPESSGTTEGSEKKSEDKKENKQ
jgi:hypothetical protein